MGAKARTGLPTSRELAVWRAYIETAEIIGGRVEARLHDDSDLSGGDYKVLLALSEAVGEPLRSSELAARIEWERSRLSAHLSRMEKRGLVRREPCADDARGTQVVLTEAGALSFRASTIPHLQAIKTFFIDAFTDEQLPQVHKTIAALRAHLGLAAIPDHPSP